jgi:hypothetical protein
MEEIMKGLWFWAESDQPYWDWRIRYWNELYRRGSYE